MSSTVTDPSVGIPDLFWDILIGPEQTDPGAYTEGRKVMVMN